VTVTWYVGFSAKKDPLCFPVSNRNYTPIGKWVLPGFTLDRRSPDGHFRDATTRPSEEWPSRDFPDLADKEPIVTKIEIDVIEESDCQTPPLPPAVWQARISRPIETQYPSSRCPMARLTLAAAFLLLAFNQAQAGEEKPTKQETMDYLKQKSNSGKMIRTSVVFDDGGSITYSNLMFLSFQDAGNLSGADYVVVSWAGRGKQRSANLPDRDLEFQHEYKCLLHQLDPAAATVRKVEKMAFFGPMVSTTQAVFELKLKITDAAKQVECTTKRFREKDIIEQHSEVYLYFTDEKTANSASKAFQHLIRESGGKVSKRDKTAIFD
jgi:hypothetical protein